MVKDMIKFSEEMTLSFSFFSSFFNGDHLLEKRIGFFWSKIFLLEVNPLLGGLHPLERQTGTHESCFPLYK